MDGPLKHKVIAIPSGSSAVGLAIARHVIGADAGLMIGAATGRQIRSLETEFPEDVTRCLQVDLDRPKSIDEFFKIAIGQFGRLDVLVVEAPAPSGDPAKLEQSIGVGARRLLHCLDATLKVWEENLHLIVIAPAASAFAIPVATAFIGAKLATGKESSGRAPTLRMSALSPIENDPDGDAALARTALHMMCERRTPNISEYVVKRRIVRHERNSVRHAKQSKIMVPM